MNMKCYRITNENDRSPRDHIRSPRGHDYERATFHYERSPRKSTNDHQLEEPR